MVQQKADIIRQLERSILSLQGSRVLSSADTPLGLGAIEEAFSVGIFPTGAIHEMH